MAGKKDFLTRHEFHDDQDFFDGLIRVDRSAYKPSPVMQRLHKSFARKRLNVGALGSGKTRTGCEHLNSMCLAYPGARVIIARKDLGDLKKTTQIEYLEKVVAPETVDRFNINEGILYYKNGSCALFMETKTPSNFKSHEIVAYCVDEADENEEGVGKDSLMTVLDGRLRQRIFLHGKEVPVPYCGIWTYNPTTEDHWLARLEDAPTGDCEVFRSTTYDNEANLPSDYIPALLASLAPWEVRSLVFGERALRPKGKPVLHGFTVEDNVRELKVFHHLPIRRSWDFGFNHPCAAISQYDPEFKRYMKIREIIGDKEQLQFFAPKVIALTRELVGPLFPVFDTCDPHGIDQKDVGESSVEYLRIHHGVHCLTKRQMIRTGLDEMQELVITSAPFKPSDWMVGGQTTTERRFLVDPSCKETISGYLGGYHRDAEGKPVKDDRFDHHADVDRYNIHYTMGEGLRRKMLGMPKRIPKCRVTGY